MRVYAGAGLLVMIAVVIAGCGDPTRVSRVPINDVVAAGNATGPLDPAKMAALAKYSEGGCSISAPDAKGTTRGFAVSRKNLPFSVPPIQHDAQTGQGNGQVVKIALSRSGAAPVALGCWVPNTLTAADLGKILAGSKGARWRGMFKQLPKGAVVPDSAKRPLLSKEVVAFRKQTLAPPPSTREANSSHAPSFDYGGTG